MQPVVQLEDVALLSAGDSYSEPGHPFSEPMPDRCLPKMTAQVYMGGTAAAALIIALPPLHAIDVSLLVQISRTIGKWVALGQPCKTIWEYK